MRVAAKVEVETEADSVPPSSPVTSAVFEIPNCEDDIAVDTTSEIALLAPLEAPIPEMEEILEEPLEGISVDESHEEELIIEELEVDEGYVGDTDNGEAVAEIVEVEAETKSPPESPRATDPEPEPVQVEVPSK